MKRILVVEDDVIICGGVKLFLEKRGYEVETAYSCKEADGCLEHGFDLILLDRNLPDGRGLDYCRELRKSTKVPIIFLTARDTEADMIEGFRAGCDDYIAKPFSVELLYQRIEAVLRRSENALACGVVMYVVLKLLQKADDDFISEVVAAMSDLLDNLSELKRQQVFPENEDSLVSRLQSKVDKIIDALKLQNSRERLEHENIKGLVSDLSHQLKTPISNLRMYTDFLKNPDISDDERTQYLQVLELAVDRLSFLSESMIKVSRLESGLINLDVKSQNINDTVLQAVKDVYVSAKNAGITIRYDEQVKCDIQHDRRWTAEACFNLLDNAIKYGKTGSEIVLSVRKLGLTVEVSVTDENEPIGENERTHIFERFYRGRNSGDKDGVGIGLYLSREIIEKQGGMLSVIPQKDGNKFVIVLQSR